MTIAKRRRFRDQLGRGLIVAFVLAYLVGLLVAPVVAILSGAFGQGVGPFLRALANPDASHALLLSLFLTAVAVLVNTILGTIVAIVLSRDQFAGRGALNAIVDIPFAISPVIVGFALILLLGPRGLLASVLGIPGLKIVFAWPGMALATIFVSIPFVIREVGLVLEQVGTTEEQAAYTLGAGPLRTFFWVTLPNIRWGLLYGVLLTTARALGEFGAVLVVSGGIAQLTETGTLFVFRALDDRRDLAAYSMSVALAAMSLLLITGMQLLKRRREQAEK